MKITVEQIAGALPVTIMALDGEMDATNFEEVIATAEALHQAGTRYLLVDMSRVSYMSSSGLIALHSMAVLMRGEQQPDPQAGWQAFHTMDRDRSQGMQHQVKLLSPQPKVAQTLEITAMNRFFEIHADRKRAIASFQPMG